MATTTTADWLVLVRETTPDVYDAMSPDETTRCLDRWNGWVDAMAATGRLRDGRPLQSSARLVSGKGGSSVIDGPFTEAKEMVGGYFLLAGLTLDEVTALAKRCPNLEHGMTVEIRPIAGACHLAHSLGWETMQGPGSAASSGS